MFGRPLGPVNCFATVRKPELRLSQVQREIITELCDNFLYGFSKTREADHDAARKLRTLISSMSKIMKKRAECYDENKVLSEKELRGLVNRLRNRWIQAELTPVQQKMRRRQKTSIHTAWVYKTFGSKAFFMAVLQMGANMMPSGASEHAHRYASEDCRAKSCLDDLVIWLARFADAVQAHQDFADATEVRRKSGTVRGQSGLTEEEQAARDRRNIASWRLRRAFALREELQYHSRQCFFQSRRPRSWMELTSCEQHLLRSLDNGMLHQEWATARDKHGGRVQAPPFRMDLF